MSRRYLHRLIRQLIILFLFGNALLFSNSGNIKFERISIRQGLSQSSVRDILQDRQGFMWFATVGGLNRFDGYTFNIKKPLSDNPNSLSSGFLQAIIEDREGILWIGANGKGLNRFDRETDTFIHYRSDHRNPDTLRSDSILCVYEDNSGILWVGTGNGLSRMNRDTGTFKTYNTSDGLPDEVIYGILEGNTVYPGSIFKTGPLRISLRKTVCKAMSIMAEHILRVLLPASCFLAV